MTLFHNINLYKVIKHSYPLYIIIDHYSLQEVQESQAVGGQMRNVLPLQRPDRQRDLSGQRLRDRQGQRRPHQRHPLRVDLQVAVLMVFCELIG